MNLKRLLLRLSPCSIGLREQTFPRSSGVGGPACRRMAPALVLRFNPVYPRPMRVSPHRGKEESVEMCRVLRAISVVCAFGWFANALLHLPAPPHMPLCSVCAPGRRRADREIEAIVIDESIWLPTDSRRTRQRGICEIFRNTQHMQQPWSGSPSLMSRLRRPAPKPGDRAGTFRGAEEQHCAE